MASADPSLTPSAAFQAAAAVDEERRATPGEAFLLARETWVVGKRVDMSELAEALGISRPTLYRWCGSRDQLLVDVIWSVTKETLDTLWGRSSSEVGAERALAVLRRYLAVVGSFAPLRIFLEHESHAALRLLTTRGAFQERLIATLATFLREEMLRSELELRAEPELVAYALVRVVEGFFYNDVAAAVDLQIERAVQVARLVLV